MNSFPNQSPNHQYQTSSFNNQSSQKNRNYQIKIVRKISTQVRYPLLKAKAKVKHQITHNKPRLTHKTHSIRLGSHRKKIKMRHKPQWVRDIQQHHNRIFLQRWCSPNINELREFRKSQSRSAWYKARSVYGQRTQVK